MTKRLIALALIIAGSTIACVDQDPFGLSRRRVAGPYEVFESEWGSYYLHRRGVTDGGLGVLDGTIERLAWNDDYIVAKRRSSSGEVDGWMVVEVATHTVTGPLSDSVMAARSAMPRASDAVSAAEAWRRLR